ncbi:YhdP family protein [Dyella jiangningensis]|uniref:YhdP family protein n=1 Tax=Dyella jiangningensis TaxID=1379159 RepID=UPI00240EABF4|nr:YhdP family protein [Dyella jiangningensis]MDG2536071.1 YhdP family protein [Dyella jiangningensis]
MKTPLHKRMQLALRALAWIAGVAVISLAVLMGLAQLLLPTLASHPDWVAQELGAVLKRPVKFDALEGHAQPAGPLFVMHGLTIGTDNGEPPLRIPEAELKLDFAGWLLPARHLVNLRARGLQVDVSREADGTWRLNGIGLAGGEERQSPSFGQLSVGLWLRDTRLEITDHRLERHYTLVAEQLRMSRQGRRIRVGALLRREGAPGQLRGAGSFSDDGADGKLWIGGTGMDLRAMSSGVDMGGYTAESGSGSFDTWLDWRDAKIVRSLTSFHLSQLSIANPDGVRANVPTLQGLAEVTMGRDACQVRWAGDDGGALVARVQGIGTDGLQASIAAKDLQLAALVPWLALKPQMSPTLAQWVGSGRPRGQIERAQVNWSRADGVQQLSAEFGGLAIDPVGKLPGVDGLKGVLRGDAQAMLLSLPLQATTLRFPHTFRQPFAMSRFGGDVAFWHEDDAWHIGTDPFTFEGAGFGGSARGEVALPDAGGRPFMDLYAAVDHADVAAAKLFWPIDSMSPAAVQWLDQALVDGKVDHGDVVVRGDLKDWPFHHNEGRFEARAELSGLVLEYGKDWPRAEGVNAVANFINSGMMVEASAAQSLGNKVDRAVALIPEFGNTVLDLNVSGSGTGASMLDFVRRSPIGRNQADVLSKLKLGGNGAFDFHLSLPVAQASELVLDGRAQLKGVDFDAPEWNLKLDKLTGPATFDKAGFHAGPLETSFRGQPSQLDLAIAGATGQPDKVLAAKLTGRYAMGELTQGYKQLDWLNQVADGRSDFTIGFDIAHANGSAATTQRLSVDSALNGMALDFPVPLKKSADATLPLHVEMNLPMQGSDVQLSVGQVVRARLRLPQTDNQQLAATFAFGTKAPDTVPDKGIRIRGRPAKLDVTGWVQYAASGSSSGGPGLESIEVNADQAMVFGHAFPDMRLTATSQADGLTVDVDSTGLAGRFSIPLADLSRRGVTARLQRLYWPKDVVPPKRTGSEATPAGATQAEASSMAPGAAATPAPNPAATGITPSALPPFHLWVSDLRFGDSKLGDARLETWPTERGMHVEQLRTLSRGVQINGTGDWEGTAGNSHSHMRIDFSAENLGEMLGAFGYDALVAGGKVRAQLDATWPGAPSAMEMGNMDGKLSINITDGRMPEVAPGVARLFGLVSVLELPRRLSFDFGDVFGKGLAFDAITGDFKLGDGNASTDNLQIRSPAAEISVKGRTGVRAKDYDLQVQAIPHAGNSLPIVGAVVGGPIGVAAGFVAQGILGKGINHAASARYKITGSWDRPVITLIEKKDVTVTPVTPPLTDEPPTVKEPQQ